MIQFLKSTLSERGEPSIKRVSLTGLLIVFVVAFFINLFTGKKPADYLQQQLFELILVCLGSVLGINILNGIKDIKFKQSDNNAAVGASSPPPSPTETTVVEAK